MSEEPPEKRLIMLAGGSGAGKGVAIRILQHLHVLDGHETRLDGHHLMRKVKRYKELRATIRHPEKTSELKGRYYYRLEKAFNAAAGQGKNIVLDDHFDKETLIERLIQRAANDNYEIVLIGLAASPDAVLNILRKTAPETTMIDPWMAQSHQQAMQAFGHLRHKTDLSLLFYREAEDKAHPVLTCAHGVEKILNPQQYAQAMNWRDANTQATTMEMLLPQVAHVSVSGSKKAQKPQPLTDLRPFAARTCKAFGL